MVIMIPMPSSAGGGAGPWRDRPSLVGLGVGAAFLAAYFAIPLYNRALFIDLPQAFGIQVSSFGIQNLIIIAGVALGMAYGFVTFITFMGAEEIRWGEWTLFALSFASMLFWILPLMAAVGTRAADFCQDVVRLGGDIRDAGCYRYLR